MKKRCIVVFGDATLGNMAMDVINGVMEANASALLSFSLEDGFPMVAIISSIQVK